MAEKRSAQRHVLFVSYMFPPIGGIGVQRPLKFARYLGDYGWQVSVITVKNPYSATMDPSLLDEIPESVRVYRVSDPASRWLGRLMAASAATAPATTSAPASNATPQDRSAQHRSTPRRSGFKHMVKQLLKRLKTALFIPDESIFWALRAAWLGRRLVRTEQIQCLYTTSGPHSTHLAGLLIHWWTGVPWVADFRDPWTDNMHYVATGWRARLERRLERMVFARASALTTVTDSFRSLFERKYPQRTGAIRVIRNGVDVNDFPPARETRARTDRLVMFYAGILYPKRSPAAFFEALSSLLQSGRLSPKDIRVQFAGVFDYPGYADNATLVRKLGLDEVVEVLGYLPHRDVLRRLQAADVLLLIGDRASGAGIYVPGKLYEYLFARRPVLALLEEGEAAELVRRAQAGVVVHPADKEQIAEEIMRLVERHKRNKPFTPDEAEIAKFTRQSQTQQLAVLMNELVRRPATYENALRRNETLAARE